MPLIAKKNGINKTGFVMANMLSEKEEISDIKISTTHK